VNLVPSYIPYQIKEFFFQVPPAAARDLSVVTSQLKLYTKEDPKYFGFEYDGKVNPSKYGSILVFDLGLCYETFFIPRTCRLGSACPWRHVELSAQETAWMSALGARCVAYMVYSQSVPVAPKITSWDVRNVL
jgi:hypothetical protein